MPKSPRGEPGVGVLGDGAGELDGGRAVRLGRRCRRPAPRPSRRASAARSARPRPRPRGPAPRRRRRASRPRPAGVALRVASVSGHGRQVDAADERQPAVDDDRLLVVAVQRALVRVELAADARPAQLVARSPHRAPGWTEDRQRRARPQEHADVDPAGELREQVADDHRGRAGAHRRSPARGTIRSRCTEVVAAVNSSTMRPSAASPSIRISSRLPARGGGESAAHPPDSAISDALPSPPSRRR